MSTPLDPLVQHDEEPDVERLLQLTLTDQLTHPLCLVHITKLDLPACGLQTLPRNFPSMLPNLKILFLPRNDFTEMPAIIGECQHLQMVSFKDCKLQVIHPDALQPQLRWLILTNNQIMDLPVTIGRCTKLQKCLLSGNLLEELPDVIENCQALELIRLASNRLREPPMKLLRLPNLKWVALADNPFLADVVALDFSRLKKLTDIDEESGIVLGKGAGGITRKVHWHGQVVAVKTFAGSMTSDGSPLSEKRIQSAVGILKSPALIQVLGECAETGSLVMEYLEHFHALANPPDFETCSRDVYTGLPNKTFMTGDQAIIFVTVLLDAVRQLHAAGICHGDFYGHNILVQTENPANVRLSDFGAACFYNRGSEYGKLLEMTEIRAFGVLVAEVREYLLLLEADSDRMASQMLEKLAKQCCSEKNNFESLHVWWKKEQLLLMANAFDF